MPTEPDDDGALDDLVIRPSTVADAPAVAELFLRAREAAFPAMPRPVHPPDVVRAWVRGWYDAPAAAVQEPWVAERDGVVVGYLMLEDDWLHSLYVEPGLTGQGIGTALLALATSLRPHGLGLWVFETNEGARRFYARHGFVEVRRTDGSETEERVPDVEMRWEPETDIATLRARIDEVDDRLAALLETRAALTAAVQAHKEVPGAAGRDPRREDEIVSRMAAQAPRLGRAGLARIMDAVISASLDAADPRP
ncbi:MAG: GNAT family N-acetyltransferase [Nocardioidaceae bacterium]